MSKVEAVKTVEQLRAELAEVKRSHRMGELTNTARMRHLRVEIARALTRPVADKPDAPKSEKEEEK